MINSIFRHTLNYLLSALVFITNAFHFALSFFVNSKAKILFKKTGTEVTLDEIIAEGGFSYVYLASDKNKKRYAVKKLNIQSKTQKEEVDKEIETMEALSHPNLLSLIDHRKIVNEQYIGTYSHYLLLPFIEQGTLQEVVARMIYSESRLDEQQVLRIFLGIANGVAFLHRQSPPLAHRDLKLGNVLLDVMFRPHVMDFGSTGLARRAIRSRSEALELKEWAETHCTNAYRPPELFDCPSECDIDERTDVWSLGCLLHGMASGASPFEDSDGGSASLAVLSGKVPVEKVEGFSAEFYSVAEWMLAFDINKRPFLDEVVKKVESLCEIKESY